jgi:hypothetical protein
MCKIHYRTIPVVQLLKFVVIRICLSYLSTYLSIFLPFLSIINVHGAGLLNSLQSCQVVQYKVAAQAMEMPG